jgi:hypothetical protein
VATPAKACPTGVGIVWSIVAVSAIFFKKTQCRNLYIGRPTEEGRKCVSP